MFANNDIVFLYFGMLVARVREGVIERHIVLQSELVTIARCGTDHDHDVSSTTICGNALP